MPPKQVETKLASQHNIVIKHAFGLADSITVSIHEGCFFLHILSILFTVDSFGQVHAEEASWRD